MYCNPFRLHNIGCIIKPIKLIISAQNTGTKGRRRIDICFLEKLIKRPLLFCCFMLAALPLWANAGLPMLFVVYPGFMAAFIPVIFIEFFYLRKSFKIAL